MLADVRQVTVRLPDELNAQLRREAVRRGTTVSALTREAIEAKLESVRPRRRLVAAGAGASGTPDASERMQELVPAELGAMCSSPASVGPHSATLPLPRRSTVRLRLITSHRDAR